MAKKITTVEQYNKRLYAILMTVSLLVTLSVLVVRVVRDCIEISEFQILLCCLILDLFLSAIVGIVCRLFANCIYDFLKKENENGKENYRKSSQKGY